MLLKPNTKSVRNRPKKGIKIAIPLLWKRAAANRAIPVIGAKLGGVELI